MEADGDFGASARRRMASRLSKPDCVNAFSPKSFFSPPPELSATRNFRTPILALTQLLALRRTPGVPQISYEAATGVERNGEGGEGQPPHAMEGVAEDVMPILAADGQMAEGEDAHAALAVDPVGASSEGLQRHLLQSVYVVPATALQPQTVQAAASGALGGSGPVPVAVVGSSLPEGYAGGQPGVAWGANAATRSLATNGARVRTVRRLRRFLSPMPSRCRQLTAFRPAGRRTMGSQTNADPRGPRVKSRARSSLLASTSPPRPPAASST